MVTMNFWIAEENRFLNGDFVSKNIKICRSISEFKLEIAP